VAVKIDTSMDPACGMSGDETFLEQQYVTKDGKLANVYVYVKSGPAAAMVGCSGGHDTGGAGPKGLPISTPHVIAVMKVAAFRPELDVTMHEHPHRCRRWG